MALIAHLSSHYISFNREQCACNKISEKTQKNTNGQIISYIYTMDNGQISTVPDNICLDFAYLRLFSIRLRTTSFRVKKATSI